LDSPRPSRNRVRLQKYLALCGLGSRRSSEAVIAGGRVSVNGELVLRQGVTVDPDADDVRVDGRSIRAEGKTYILLNKPRDVLCTCSDPSGRRTFLSLLPALQRRVFPVGRLDRDSEGMLIATNDGAFAHSLMHPRHHVLKTYQVWVSAELSSPQLARMRAGVDSLGEMLHVESVELRSPGGGRGRLYEIVLAEGRNRHLRRIFEVLGVNVLRLKRVRIGCLDLGDLKPGKWRYLTPAEVRALAGAEKDKISIRRIREDEA